MDVLLLVLIAALIAIIIFVKILSRIGKLNFDCYTEKIYSEDAKENLFVEAGNQKKYEIYKRNPLIEPILIYNGIKKVVYPDDKYPRNMLYWSYGESGIDLTYQGLCVLNLIDKILKRKTNYLKNFINEFGSKLYSFLEINFKAENGQGGFKHNPRAWASLYGNCTAISILNRLHGKSLFKDMLGKDKLEELLNKKNYEKFLKFLSNCCVDTAYGICYAETPFENPTLVDLDSAIHIYYDLGLFDEVKKDIERMRSFIFSCSKSLKSEEGKQLVGFSNFPTINKPCSSLTRYALNTLLRLFALEKEKSVGELIEEGFSIDDIIPESFQEGILNFLVTCRSNAGAFSPYSYETNQADLYHTNIAVNLVNETMNGDHKFELRKEDIVLFDKLRKYLESCKIKSEGFDILPDNYRISSLYATRCGMGTISSLMDLFPDKEIIKEEGKFIEDIVNFTNLCIDKKNGAFYGYAIASE